MSRASSPTVKIIDYWLPGKRERRRDISDVALIRLKRIIYLFFLVHHRTYNEDKERKKNISNIFVRLFAVTHVRRAVIKREPLRFIIVRFTVR